MSVQKLRKATQAVLHDGLQAVPYSDDEVRRFWQEVKAQRGWTRGQLWQAFRDANPDYIGEVKNWNHKRLEKFLVLTPENGRREPVPPEWHPRLAKTLGWSVHQYRAYLATGVRPAGSAREGERRISANGPVATKLEASMSGELERRYVAFSRDGLYDSAASLAHETLAGAESAQDKRLMAHWSDRMADAYRAMGRLRDASSFYAKAWANVQDALAEAPGDFELRKQAGFTKFGQIMVDDYLTRGAFGEAYRRHAQLLKDVDSLLKDAPSDSLRAGIPVRRIHIKRQQAEMLRYLGRYREALTLIREVFKEYPTSAYEPRCYARLSEADSLRLQGDSSSSLDIYVEIEDLARDRDLPGLLGAVLWRKACALQCQSRDDERRKCLGELAILAPNYSHRYRFMGIYSLLVRASGRVADEKEAQRNLSEAEIFGPLRPDYLVAEYAHSALCHGELARQCTRIAEAREWFEKAFSSYLAIECRWGGARAWVGLRLTGGDATFPRNLKQSMEGADARLLEEFETRRSVHPGVLSMNLP